MRIARIGPQHFISIKRSIQLVNKLKSHGFNVILLMVGYVEQDELLEKLKKVDDLGVTKFVTSDDFTVNANQLMPVADAIIGTGRGIMEGASFSKPLLIPLQNYPTPILMDSVAFNSLYYYNFSPRSKFDDFNEDAHVNKIKEIIQEHSFYKKHAEYAFHCFEKHFIIDAVVADYIQIYRTVKNTRSNAIIDFMIHGYKVSKEFLRSKIRKI